MTYISKVFISSFKSIKKYTEVPISPITLIFGPNSAGKSSVIDAIEALRAFSSKPECSIDYENEIISKAFVDNLEAPAEAAEKESLKVFIFKDPLDGNSNLLACPNTPYKSAFLGVELADFLANKNIEDDYTESRLASSAGYELYQGLSGSTIKIGTTQNFLFKKFSGHLSKIVVDGDCLITFQNLTTTIIPSNDNYQPGNFEPIVAQNGSVVINLDHIFWSSIESSVSANELVVRLSRLKKFDADRKNPAVNDWLTFSDGQLLLKGQSDFLIFTFDIPSIISNLNNSLGGGVDVVPIIQDIRFVANALKAFGLLMQRSLASALAVNSISGDRFVLKPRELEYSYLAKPEQLSAMSSYALQLANNKLDYDAVNSAGENIPCEDFVNEILQKDIFGVRKYAVKAEVWKTKTEEVVPRVHNSLSSKVTESPKAVDQMLVKLYLEDQNGRALDFIDVGSGVSYIVPILASLQVYKTSWIAQPELHLHPAAQCAMGDVFVRAYNRQKFSVIETHSEHLLLRILRRIRETSKGTVVEDDLKCHPEAVTVLYFKPEADGGVDVRQLRVSRFGDFKDRWPDGFFEERGRELFDE